MTADWERRFWEEKEAYRGVLAWAQAAETELIAIKEAIREALATLDGPALLSQLDWIIDGKIYRPSAHPVGLQEEK